jgi:hypothetical protein
VCDPQHVDTPQLPHARLDAYIRERADELGMRLKDVADFIDVAEPTLVGWRYGTQRPTLRYAQRLDDFMGWRRAPSSTLEVLDGGEPLRVRDKPIRPRNTKSRSRGTKKTSLPRTEQQPLVAEGDDDVAGIIAKIEADQNLKQEQKDLLVGHLRAAAQYTLAQARQLSEQQATERDRAS